MGGQTIGQKFRVARRKLGMTQRQLGTAVGIDHSVISRIESDDADATPDSIMRIATWLAAQDKSLATLAEDAEAELITAGVIHVPLQAEVPGVSKDEQRRMAAIERRLWRLSPDTRKVAFAAVEGVLDSFRLR